MQNIPNKTGGITTMAIIETHYVDQSPEFIKLYNQGQTPKQIQKTLQIGKGAYYTYLKDNRKHLQKLTLKCPVCGKIFTKTNNNQRYCTKKCRVKAKYQRDKKRGKYVLQRNK